MKMPVPILATAGTATGLLAVDMTGQDLIAHPKFAEALATHRAALVKTLTAEELEGHPAFTGKLKGQVETGVAAALAALKDETLETIPVIKAFIDKKVQAAVVSSESAKAFLALVQAAGPAGVVTGHETPKPVAATFPKDSSEGGNKLEIETRAIMASDSKIGYAEAMITAAKKIGYGGAAKEGGA